jgi:hypothetical protein
METVYGEGTAGMLQAMGDVMREAGREARFAATRTLENWFTDPYSYDQVKRGVARLLSALEPDGAIELPPLKRGGPPDLEPLHKWHTEHLGEGRADDPLAEIASGKTQRAVRLQRYLKNDLIERVRSLNIPSLLTRGDE